MRRVLMYNIDPPWNPIIVAVDDMSLLIKCYLRLCRVGWLLAQVWSNSVFNRFRQAKFAYVGLILSLSKFLLLPQRHFKKTLAMKIVKIYSLKIIILLPWSKSVKRTVSVVNFTNPMVQSAKARTLVAILWQHSFSQTKLCPNVLVSTARNTLNLYAVRK